MKFQNLMPLILISLSLASIAQNTYTSQMVGWFSVTEKVLLNDSWNVSLNIQQRQFTKTNGSFQFLTSASVENQLNKSFFAGIGFMYFDFRLMNPVSSELIDLTELRPYEFVSLKYRKNNIKFFNRIMLEQRFQRHLGNEGVITENYHFNHRIRIKWQITLPVNGNLSFILSDEPMINFGPDINGNTFDQNRLIALASYNIQENLTLRTGYMNWLFNNIGGSTFDIRHVWLVQLNHIIKRV